MAYRTIGRIAASLFAAGGTNTRFGRQFGTHLEFFGGKIDDVRVYDYALNATEMAAVAAVPKASSWAMLLAGLGMIGFVVRKRLRG